MGSMLNVLLRATCPFLLVGCTFYTSCPPTEGTPDGNAGAGGSAQGTGGDIISVGGNAPQGVWVDVTSNLAGMDSECGNVSLLSAKPDENELLVSIAQAGLWSSDDGGTSWSAIGTGRKSAQITNRGSSIVYDPDEPSRYWESGTYNGGGVYRTDDDGNTFIQLGDVVHVDQVSVDFSDPDRQTLLAGGHETPRRLTQSSDGGQTWNPIGSGLPDGTNCDYPLVIDFQTYLVGCGGYGGGPAGIYISTDSGVTWSKLSNAGGTALPLKASDGSIYWISADGGMARSTDGGLTWSQAVAPRVLMPIAPVELPDKRIGALSSSKTVVVSADHGATWTQVSVKLPFEDPSGFAYSAQEKAFFVKHFTCANGPLPVPDKAIQRYDFDYTSQ